MITIHDILRVLAAILVLVSGSVPIAIIRSTGVITATLMVLMVSEYLTTLFILITFITSARKFTAYNIPNDEITYNKPYHVVPNTINNINQSQINNNIANTTEPAITATQATNSPDLSDVTNTTIQSSQLTNQQTNRSHIDYRNNQLQQLNYNYNYNHQNIENYNQHSLINNNHHNIPHKHKKEDTRTLDRITHAVHIGCLVFSIASIIAGLYWIDTNFFDQTFADSVNPRIVMFFIPFYVISLIIRFIPLTHYFYQESAKDDPIPKHCDCACKNSTNSSRQVSDGTTLNVNQFFPPQENSIPPLPSNINSQYTINNNNNITGGDTHYHTDFINTQKALIEKRLDLVSPQEQLNNDKKTKDIFNFYTEHQTKQMELQLELQVEAKMKSNKLHEQNYDLNSPNSEFFFHDNNIYSNDPMTNAPLHKKAKNHMLQQDHLQLELIKEHIEQNEQQYEGEHRVRESTSSKHTSNFMNDDYFDDMQFQNFDGNYYNDNSDHLDQQTNSSNEVHENVNHSQKHEDKKTIEYLDYEYNIDEGAKIKSTGSGINSKHRPKVSNASSGLKVPESIIETDEEYVSGDAAVQQEANKVSSNILKPLVVLSPERRLQNFSTSSPSSSSKIPVTPTNNSLTRSTLASPTKPIITDRNRESTIENLYYFGSGEEDRNATHENDEEIEFPDISQYYLSPMFDEHDDKSDNDDADVVSLTQIKSTINSTSKRYSANDTLQNIKQLTNNKEKTEDSKLNEINNDTFHSVIDIDVNDIEDILTGDLAEIPTHSNLQWPTNMNKHGINHISLESWNKNSDIWMKDKNRIGGEFPIFNKRPHIDHYTVTDGFSPKHNAKYSTSNSDPSVMSALVSDTNAKELMSGFESATSSSTSSGALNNKLKSYMIPPLNYNNTNSGGGSYDSGSVNDQVVYTDNEDENEFYTSLRNESFISSYEILSKSNLDKMTTSPNLSNNQANNNNYRNSKYTHRQSQSEDPVAIGNNNNSSPTSLRHYKSFIHKRSNSSSPIKKLKNLKTDLSNGIKNRRSLDDVRPINFDFIEQLQYSPTMNYHNNGYHDSRSNNSNINNNHVSNRSKSNLSSPSLRSPSRRPSFNNSLGNTNKNSVNRRKSVISLKKSGSIGKLFNIGLGINDNNTDTGNAPGGGNTNAIISGNDSINGLNKDINYVVSSDINVKKLSKTSESLWTHSDSSKESFYPDSVIGEYDREKWKTITKNLNTESN